MPTPSRRTQNELTYYEILDLQPPTHPSTNPSLTIQDVRKAYHRALLAYHPDKTASGDTAAVTSRPTTLNNDITQRKRYTRKEVPSVTAIQEAYHTLSNPAKRAEYDNVILHQRGDGVHSKDVNGMGGETGHEGVETLDLDDMHYSARVNAKGEEKGQWSWPCRCGNADGYVVTEEELEAEVELDLDHETEKTNGKVREVFVGCRGCSLFIRVVFDVESE